MYNLSKLAELHLLLSSPTGWPTWPSDKNHLGMHSVLDVQLVEAVIRILSIRTIRLTKVLWTKMKTTAVAFNEYNSN
jgi:hypothetical protein